MFAKLAQSLGFWPSACGPVKGRAVQRQSSRPSLGHYLARAAASPRLRLAAGTGDRPARMLLASRAGRRSGGRRPRDKLDDRKDGMVAQRLLGQRAVVRTGGGVRQPDKIAVDFTYAGSPVPPATR